jgi:hypothetical protein
MTPGERNAPLCREAAESDIDVLPVVRTAPYDPWCIWATET